MQQRMLCSCSTSCSSKSPCFFVSMARHTALCMATHTAVLKPQHGSVAVLAGRKPFTEGLGLEDVGVKTDNRGRIEVDDHFNTSVKVPRC